MMSDDEWNFEDVEEERPLSVWIREAPLFCAGTISDVKRSITKRLLGGFLHIIDTDSMFYIEPSLSTDGLMVWRQLRTLDEGSKSHPIWIGETEH